MSAAPEWVPRLAFVVLAATASACSKGAPPREDRPPAAASSITSASQPAPRAAAARAPLLPDDPNWTRADRIARVVSVTPCGKKDGRLCKRLVIKNEGNVAIAAIVELRLCAYDAKGKALGTNGYNHQPEKPIAIERGATVTVEHLVNDDDAYANASALEGEVVIARLAGAPKGRHWVNTNLAADDRPRGGFDAKALAARATMPVRALSFEPTTGIVKVRNETKRAITKMALSAYGWRRGDAGELVKVGGVMFLSDKLKLGAPLGPGEERELDLGGGEKDRYTKPGVVAHTVVASGVAYEDGVMVYNANVDADVSERAGEDLPAPAR